MASGSSARIHQPEEVLEISRVFDAPPALLFKLWADPAHRVRWWGPTGMALVRCEVDFRVGGAWSSTMARADGYEHPVHGVFTEIEVPTRLCFTYVNTYDSHDMLVEMDFYAEGNGTRMRFVQSPFKNVPERDGHRFGWTSTFGLLDAYAARVRAAGDARPAGAPRQPGDA